MKKLAVILVTYNGERWIERCLNDLESSSYPIDIFAVDNCSTDSTLEILRSHSIFDIEITTSNLGFGAANNIALKKALDLHYDYFFLVNQDVYIEKESIEKLVDFSTNHKQFGIIAPVQLTASGVDIDHNFQQYINLSDSKENHYDTKFVNAAAWLLTRECLQTVGGFNNRMFPHYGEDRDFCNRVMYHNFSISIVKNVNVIHDRVQRSSFDKAIKLSKIKLLTIFLNPNYSMIQSAGIAFINVFGMAKFFIKNYQAPGSLARFFKEYVRLFFKRNLLEQEKLKHKKSLKDQAWF